MDAAKGEAGAAPFLFLSCLGFFFSLLLLCSRLAMTQSLFLRERRNALSRDGTLDVFANGLNENLPRKERKNLRILRDAPLSRRTRGVVSAQAKMA
jgi:hypothetical protein